MSKFYTRPVCGRGYRPFTTEMVDVTIDNVKTFQFKKLITWQKRNYAIFSSPQCGEMMQSLKAIAFVRCRPGEDNVSSKLSNVEGIAIYERAAAGENKEALAKEYNVTVSTVRDIFGLRQRTAITMRHLNGEESVPVATATTARPNGKKKLSESLANFIRKDHATMALTAQQLAKKYCVSDRTIQRILKGQMYRSNDQK